ncbi:helix-turn-helix transcriptional regulator [Mycolicibacterium sphagni]|uniref:helix-turn-helix transcriptional regulator n=1 Tax=Mycolicibacterium sphagni TaxID=1786 RepID=UPI0021F2984B|nr:helix-turn-helix domain-containing protein [Mycolicibacterium sphagni]MCV7174801.1 helix-turn-helix domain-containing protein [Mycolicibacterium sphagni]
MNTGSPAIEDELPVEDEWSPRWHKVVELTRAGHSVRQIAEIVGIQPRSVTRIRQHTGLTKHYVPPRPWTDEEKATAKAMLDDGVSYKEVGRTLGRDRHKLYKMFPGYAWPPEKRAQHSILIKQLNRIGVKP